MFPRPWISRFPPTSNNNPQPPDQQVEDEQYYPGIYDVLKVRHILLWKVRPEGLPAEVVDMIVDAAEYWPSTVSRMDGEKTVRKDVDQALLSTGPLCYDENTLDTSSPRVVPHRGIHPCRKIIFTIVSHDQGGASHLRTPPNPYEGSWTWFDAQVTHNAHQPSQREAIQAELNPGNRRPRHFGPDDPLLLPKPHKLQSNKARIQPPQRHTIVWHHLDDTQADSQEAEEIERSQGRGRATLDGKQVREMEIGDSILVWARARFPGWINYVNELSVRIFWAI